MKNKASPPIIVQVHRPELTPEERDRRMEVIKKAATDLIVATMRNSSRPCGRLPVNN